MKPHWTEILEKYGACSAAIRELRQYRSRSEAWRKTPHVEDLLWWLGRVAELPAPQSLRPHRVGPESECPNCQAVLRMIRRRYPTPPRPASR